MKLRAEDGAGFMDHAFIGAVVEVDKVLFVIWVQARDVDSIAVVLRGNVAAARGQVEGGDVVGAVAVLELDGLGAGGHGEELVAETDAEDGELVVIDDLAKVVSGSAAVGWVAWAVGDEDAVEVLRDVLDGVVKGKDGDGGAAGDEGAHDVFLDTAVDESDVEVAGGGDVEGLLGGDAADEVDCFGVGEGFIFIGIVLVADCDACEGRTLFTKVGDDFTGVDTGDGGNAGTSTPLSQRLYSGPMAVVFGSICYDYTSCLKVRRLEMAEKSEFISGHSWDTIVSNEWLSKDQNLSAIGRIGERFWVTNKRCGKDGFSRYVYISTEALSREDGSVLEEATVSILYRQALAQILSNLDGEGGSSLC